MCHCYLTCFSGLIVFILIIHFAYIFLVSINIAIISAFVVSGCLMSAVDRQIFTLFFFSFSKRIFTLFASYFPRSFEYVYHPFFSNPNIISLFIDFICFATCNVHFYVFGADV